MVRALPLKKLLLFGSPVPLARAFDALPTAERVKGDVKGEKEVLDGINAAVDLFEFIESRIRK